MSVSYPFDDAIAAERQGATASSTAMGVVVGAPKAMLRLEGAVVLFGASMAYSQVGQGWWFFAALFLVPDLSMLGYLAGRRIGAVGYNLGHSYILPAALGALGVFLSQPVLVALSLIWAAHIGFDRMLGYGLKYPTAFGHTHLGVVGKLKRQVMPGGED